MATSTSSRVSVVIPTLAAPERARHLERALESIRAASVNPVQIIAVVNGARFDASICEWLQAQNDVRFEYVHAPSAPGAVLRGRELVQTEYFSTLDDDDEFLPGALDRRMAGLDEASADFLVTNAFRNVEGTDSRIYSRLLEVPRAPLECLMQFPWLNGDNALYKTASVGTEYFQNYHPHAIWTWLAFKLAMEHKRVAVLDEVTCRIHDTSMSVSKSTSYSRALVPLFQRMLERSPPPVVKHMIRRKLSAAYHNASVSALADGRRVDAWKTHVRSLIEPSGMRYLPYTRHLLK